MSGETKILNTETGLMNYQHTRCISGGSRMLTETIIDFIGACQVKINV